MTLPESLLIALYCISGVMILLAVLYFILILFSKIFNAVGDNKVVTEPVSENPDIQQSVSTAGEFSSGQLKLKDVDEPTAAMIMAIISDESGIPLSQLCFKSIKLLQKA